jgi:SAM-dependent methyltransferase
MSNLTNPELLQCIVCPVCGGDLIELTDHLNCSRCPAEYEIRMGIPLLYPPSLDFTHLREEEKLAQMMKFPNLTEDEAFNSSQWIISKREFWETVQRNMQPSPSLIINIGCGYDEGFNQFEQAGHTFVNFDMVYNMLIALQNNGAKSCVGGDVNRLPFKKGIFDYVISVDLIHHESNNLYSLLQGFQELLKPGGVLFLEDPNAWGIFQMGKSIFLPKFLYWFFRKTYHAIKRSIHRPADYEFPTNVWHVKGMLEKLGFQNIQIHPNIAYPCISKANYRFYNLFSKFEYVKKFHNYHYRLSAIKE